MRSVTRPVRISGTPVSSTAPANTSPPLSSRTRTCAFAGTALPARPRPAQDDAQHRRLAGLDGRADRPRVELDRALERTLDGLADRRPVEPRVGRREDPAASRLRPAHPVDLEERRHARDAARVGHVDERAQDAVAPGLRPPAVLRVGAGPEAHVQRPRALRLGQRTVPRTAGRGDGLQRAGEHRRAQLVGRADEQLVRKGRLAWAEHVAAGFLSHRLVERRAAEHHEATAVLHEVADGRPGLEREGAAVGQHEHGVAALAEARGQGGRRVEGVGRHAGERRAERHVVDGRRVGGREAGRTEHGHARRRGQCRLGPARAGRGEGNQEDTEQEERMMRVSRHGREPIGRGSGGQTRGRFGSAGSHTLTTAPPSR